MTSIRCNTVDSTSNNGVEQMPRIKKEKTVKTKATRKKSDPVLKIRNTIERLQMTLNSLVAACNKYNVNLSLSAVSASVYAIKSDFDDQLDKGLTITVQRGRRDRVFEVGDRVEVEGTLGEVKEVRGEGTKQNLVVEFDSGERMIAPRRLVKKAK